MKLSVDDMTGPDPEKAALCMRAIVTLDGKKVERCVMADEEKGEVEYLIDNDDPRWKREFFGVDYWPSEKKYGKVRIIDPQAVSLHEVYSK